jgi:methionine sulfoxide reductase heme-binding subunit
MTKSGRIWYLVALGVALLIVVLAVNVLGPRGRPIDLVIRSAATLGYTGVFLAALSSTYIRELTRFFGTPFIKVHHDVAVTSLILLTVHPLGVAIRSGTLAVFVPDFGSWFGFFLFGGRQAWYLLGIAALVALATVRRRLPRSWRTIHMLNYLAFAFGTVHAWLIGTNFQGVVGRAVLGLMTLIMVLAFIQKRQQMARVASRRRGRGA